MFGYVLGQNSISQLFYFVVHKKIFLWYFTEKVTILQSIHNNIFIT